MAFSKRIAMSSFVAAAVFALALCLVAASTVTAHAATTGWKLVDGNTKLVYIQKGGEKAVSQTIDGIKLGADGYAKSTTASKLKIAIMKNIKKLTKSGMTRDQKLRACFNYNMVQDWWNVEPTDYGEEGWMARFALARVNLHKGECFSFAILNAYYAYELGYKNVTVYCLPQSHAFVMIGDKCLDNMYGGVFLAAPKNSKAGMKKWVIKSWAATSPAGVTKTQKYFQSHAGLTKYKSHYYFVKNGKPVKNAWKKVSGKKYYFDSKGRAVTGSQEIDGKWYVFSAKGKLLTGKSTRTVTVKGVSYRVKKNGRAAAGWNAGHTKYYLANGARAKGLCCTDRGIVVFTAKGAYRAEQTAALQKLVQPGASAEELIKALAKIETPKVKTLGDSCYDLEDEPGLLGKDRRYTYSHLVMDVFVADDGRLILEGISAC